jgi:hypothetical protein
MRPKLKPDEIVFAGDAEPGIFYMGSRSSPGGDPHRIDICAHDGVGSCECQNYVFNLHGQLEKGFRGKHLRCYHNRKVRELVDQLFTEQERKKQQAKRPQQKADARYAGAVGAR